MHLIITHVAQRVKNRNCTAMHMDRPICIYIDGETLMCNKQQLNRGFQ